MFLLREKKEFTEYFGKTPEYYLINPKGKFILKDACKK